MHKNKSTINIVVGAAVFVTVLLVGIVLTSASRSGAASDTSSVSGGPSGTLTISEESWNFGEISMRDGNVTKEIALTNDSDNPVTITALETSCMCTKVQIVHEDGSKSEMKGMVGHGGNPAMSEQIMPGEQAKLAVTFDPNAHGPNATGPISRTVSMKTDSMDQSSVTLRFSGNVTK